MKPTDTTKPTGVSEPDSVPTSKSKSKGKAWTIFSIIIIFGLAAGLAFFIFQSIDKSQKISDLEADLSTETGEVAQDQENSDTTEDSEAEAAAVEIDLTVFYDAMIKAGLSKYTRANLGGSRIMTSANGEYNIAKFGVFDVRECQDGDCLGGGIAFFYRALPDGEWTYSNFSGNGLAMCNDVTDAEKAAFAGIVNCTN